MTEELEQIQKAAEELGALKDRNRIMKELLKADLPLGVWPLIRTIINPPK